jgi:hypothetical protein
MARARRWWCLAVAAVVAFAATAAGCTPDFENPTTIKDLRLLAVQADPPEFVIDLDQAMQTRMLPDTVGPVKLVPLIVDPNGAGRPVEYKVMACGNEPAGGDEGRNEGPGNVRDTIAQAPCPPGALVVAEGSVAGREDGTVPLEVTFTPTAELLYAAVLADPLSVQLGLPITVAFTLRAGDEQVVGLKRVIFTPRLSAAQTPNRNPAIDRLLHRPKRADEPVPFLPEGPPVEVALGAEMEIVASPAEAEPYEARAYSRTERRFVIEQVSKETMRYSFFATKGTFSPPSVSTEPSPIRTNPIIELASKYQAPEALGPDESPDVDIFVIVRDERGGANFARAKLRLVVASGAP